MLRAIRFATQLDFSIEQTSLNAIFQERERLKIITKERIVEELNKIMATAVPSKGFLLLDQVGLLEDILP